MIFCDLLWLINFSRCVSYVSTFLGLLWLVSEGLLQGPEWPTKAPLCMFKIHAYFYIWTLLHLNIFSIGKTEKQYISCADSCKSCNKPKALSRGTSIVCLIVNNVAKKAITMNKFINPAIHKIWIEHQLSAHLFSEENWTKYLPLRTHILRNGSYKALEEEKRQHLFWVLCKSY